MRGTSKAKCVTGWLLAVAVGVVPAYSRAEPSASLENQQAPAKTIVTEAKSQAKASAVLIQAMKATALAPRIVKASYGEPLCGPSYDHITILSDPPGAYVYGQDGDYWDQTSAGSGVTRLFDCPYGEGGEGACRQFYTVTLRKSGYETITHTFPMRFRFFGGPASEVWDCQKYQDRALAQRPRKVIVVMEPLRSY